jgi:glycosyltransferase involved in cell wall biosynthesis
VIVSESVGCAEDLLVAGPPAGLAELRLVPPLKQTSGLRQNGFVFNPESSEALAAALADLSLHPELRAVMGHASRRIVETFSCEAFAENALRGAHAALEGLAAC